MKKLLAIALLTTLPMSSQAVTQKDCVDLHGFSDVVMRAKVAGVDMMKIIDGFSKDSWGELLTKVTIDAYSQTTYNSKKLNEKVANNFAGKWLGSCMKSVK